MVIFPSAGYFRYLIWVLFKIPILKLKKKKIQQEIYLEFFQDYEVDFVCLAILN